MIQRAARVIGRLRGRIARLPRGVLVALAIVLVAGAAVGGALLYRTYNYVQHDNNFCLSCHLMADPFERFAQSAHRGLGCKACHQPTMAVRSRMALTQIIEQPEQLETHAEVPNERCVECHVDGDPGRWRQISASAGHRVHFESDEPGLQGLQCVQCHSSSVHEFAATDRTCGQGGCHETTQIKLGRMANLTIHCASCHDFNAPIATSASADTLAVALSPRREECLSCHAMRLLVDDFPPNDVHQAACGACHNPHTQATPAQAVESCGACHTSIDTLTAFHRGVPTATLTNCTACHDAHAFTAQTECSACHQNVAMTTHVTLAGAPGGAAATFEHARHNGVACTACHASTQTHGETTLRSFTECRQCHHEGSTATTCTNCHQAGELNTPQRIPQTLRLTAARPATRALPFEHRVHQTEQCSACHENNINRSAASVSCSSCHEKHHTAETNCRACHTAPPRPAHPMRSHVSCAGSGCHTAVPFQGVPRTRQLCLSCHQDLVAHNPTRNCVDCHNVPQGREP